MSSLDDTCLLYRGGETALMTAKEGAIEVATAGGSGTAIGRSYLQRLDRQLLDLHVSPGGSADLLAATLFLDAVERRQTEYRRTHMEQIEFDYPAKRKISRRAHVGVVGSGELEVLLEPGEGERSHVFIRTSVNGFRETWKAVLDRFFAKYDGDCSHSDQRCRRNSGQRHATSGTGSGGEGMSNDHQHRQDKVSQPAKLS